MSYIHRIIWFDLCSFLSTGLCIEVSRQRQNLTLTRLCTWTILNVRLWSKLFKTLGCIQKKPCVITNHPSATLLPSLWLKRLKSKERSCLWKPRHDTQRCSTPMAAWAEADRRLMTLDAGSLQTASWISYRLLLTCALIRSQSLSAASRGPERLCKLRDRRLMQKTQSSAAELTDGGNQLLTCGMCCYVNIFDALHCRSFAGFVTE